MSDFMDSFGEGMGRFFSSVKSAARVVAEKTKEGASWTKLTFQIQEEESKIEKLYTKLGERVLIDNGVDAAWEKEIKKGNPLPSGDEIIHEIKEHRAVVLNLRKQLESNKSAATDEPSGENYSESRTNWQSDTSEAAPRADEVIAPPMSSGVRVFKFCPSCNCGNLPNVKRCIYCGYNFNEK